MTTINAIAKAHNINADAIKTVDKALSGLGALYAILQAKQAEGLDSARAYLKDTLRPVAVGRTYGVANLGMAQRDPITAEALQAGYDICAGKLKTDAAKDALVKSAPKISQYYKDAGVNHPFAKASAPKANKAHKGASAPAKVKAAKVKTEKKTQSFETIKSASEFNKRLLDNRKITDLTFPANNYGLAAPKLAALLKKQYEELEALIATIKD